MDFSDLLVMDEKKTEKKTIPSSQKGNIDYSDLLKVEEKSKRIDYSSLLTKPAQVATKLVQEGVKPFIGQVPFGKEIAETKPVKQFYEAGARYPKSIFSGLEALQTGLPVLPALQKGFLAEKRTPTEISWQMADRTYKKPSTNVAWEFVKQFPYTSAGKLGEIFLDPAVMLTFKGVNKVLLDPAVSKVMATEIPAPKWLDTAIQRTVKGVHKPFGDLARAVKENRIDTITNELYNKFKPQMSELEASYQRVYKVKPTESDMKGLIKSKLVKAGIFDKSLVELQKALFKARKFAPKVKVTPEPIVTPEGVVKPALIKPPIITPEPTIPPMPIKTPITITIAPIPHKAGSGTFAKNGIVALIGFKLINKIPTPIREITYPKTLDIFSSLIFNLL